MTIFPCLLQIKTPENVIPLFSENMPVTSALAARLAKRGIKINKEGPKEEIFAESRSEPKEETVIDEFG